MNSDLETAVRLSSGAYDACPKKTPEFRKRVVGGPCGEVVADIHEIDDKTWVAFRGTDDFLDILYNLRMCELEIDGVGVHRGFWEMFKCVEREIVEEIKAPKRLALTGHSMGGALALLAGPFLASPETSVECFGIAAPRVGNAKFREFHARRVARTVVLINGRDPVPHEPCWPGYVRPGEAIWVLNGTSRSYPEDFGIWQRLWHVVTCGNILDHRISCYDGAGA